MNETRFGFDEAMRDDTSLPRDAPSISDEKTNRDRVGFPLPWNMVCRVVSSPGT